MASFFLALFDIYLMFEIVVGRSAMKMKTNKKRMVRLLWSH